MFGEHVSRQLPCLGGEGLVGFGGGRARRGIGDRGGVFFVDLTTGQSGASLGHLPQLLGGLGCLLGGLAG